MLKTNQIFSPTRQQLMQLYEQLIMAYGDLPWWTAETDFEIVVGAILTQNTNWSNVEKALVNLKAADALSLTAILSLEQDQLAQLIRPSGYYNIKAKRLVNLCRFLEQQGGLEKLADIPLPELRSRLLAVNGVGPETADDIILYALDLPAFVIDTYTRRLLSRHGLAEGNESYAELQRGFESVLPSDTNFFKQYHALIVEHAKQSCRKKPECFACCIQENCLQNMS